MDENNKAIKSGEDRFKDIKQADRAWIATFFGTSIGSGILFLPVMSGRSGLYVTIIVMIVAFIVSYFAQKMYGLVLVNSEKAYSYNQAIEEYLGSNFSGFISVLFMVLLFGGLLVFSTGLNTDIGEFLYTYKITSSNMSSNIAFPFILIFVITMFMVFSERFLLKFINKLTIHSDSASCSRSFAFCSILAFWGFC